MQYIEANPYRIIGVFANASEKDILKQKNKFSAYSRANKIITSELDFSFRLPVITRTPDIIDQAFSAIELAEDKIFHSLFWFVNAQPIDNVALENLKLGNMSKAQETWEKLTNAREITEKNITAFNNLSTLKLIKGELPSAYTDKLNLIESNAFNSFCQTIVGSTFKVNREIFLERIIERIVNDNQDDLIWIKLFANKLDNQSYAKQYLLKKVSANDFFKIEHLIDEIEQNLQQNLSLAIDYATKLYKNTQKSLSNLEYILGENIQLNMLKDNIAEILRACANRYRNEFHDSDEWTKEKLQDCLKIIELAISLANKNQLVNQLMEDKESYQEEIKNFNVDNEIKQLMEDFIQFKEVTQTSEDAYKFSAKIQNRLIKLKQTLGENNEVYLKISSAIVMACLNVSIDEVNKIQQLRNISALKVAVRNAVTLLTDLQSYDMDYQTKQRLTVNFNTVKDMSQKLKVHSHISSKSNNDSNNDGNTNYFWMLMLLIIVIIAIINK